MNAGEVARRLGMSLRSTMTNLAALADKTVSLTYLCATCMTVLAACNHPRSHPTLDKIAVPSSESTTNSACGRIREMQAAACKRVLATISRPDCGSPSCASADAHACVEMNGGWGAAIENYPCPPHGMQRAEWVILHTTPDGRTMLSRPMAEPNITLEEGRVRVDFSTCGSESDGYQCTRAVGHTCIGSQTSPMLLDCMDSYKLKRPAWIPESFEGWSDGAQSLTFQAASLRKEAILEAVPLVLADGDASNYLLPGPKFFGRVDDAGIVAFDATEDVERDRKECDKLPVPSRASTDTLWRSAVCARLNGKSLSWVAREWRTWCTVARPPVDRADGGAYDGAYDFPPACRVDARTSNTFGVPRVVLGKLQEVVPWH